MGLLAVMGPSKKDQFFLPWFFFLSFSKILFFPQNFRIFDSISGKFKLIIYFLDNFLSSPVFIKFNLLALISFSGDQFFTAPSKSHKGSPWLTIKIVLFLYDFSVSLKKFSALFWQSSQLS